MTVIATYAIDGCPVLFGDLLVTTDSAPDDRIVSVPSQGEVQDFFGSSGWRISGLNQKVNLISNTCALAWSGKSLGARIVISGLRELALTKVLTRQLVTEFIQDEADLQRHPASFIGLIYEEGNIVRFHLGAEEQFQSASLGTVFLSGSGSLAIHEFSKLLESYESRITGSASRGDVAIAKSLTLGGLLLQSEFRGGDAATTLRHMFGGGYEIAFCSNSRIQKLAEVTYVFWEASLATHAVEISHPQLVVKQQYAGDFLLIRSARATSSPADPTPRLVNEQHHAIRPMFRAGTLPTVQQLEDVSLQSRLQCHCILVHRDTEAVGIYTLIRRYSPESEVSITFADEDGRLIFGLRQDTAIEIVQAIERFRTEGTR